MKSIALPCDVTGTAREAALGGPFDLAIANAGVAQFEMTLSVKLRQ